MFESYAVVALLLFTAHIVLRRRYGNTVFRCFLWAVLWPLDVAICVRDWLRHHPKEGGQINNAALALEMRRNEQMEREQRC